MIVRLRFFASIRERLNRSEAEQWLPEHATVGDLWSVLCTDHPQLATLSASVSFAVNREYVDRQYRLSENDEVALIPPVSGGSEAL